MVATASSGSNGLTIGTFYSGGHCASGFFEAVKGGPNNEPQTITSSTRPTATIRWTDASGKTWQRSGSGRADAARVDLGTPVQMRT
jgi:hypothetical protein